MPNPKKKTQVVPPSTAKLSEREKLRLSGYLAQQTYHQEEAAKFRGIVRDLVAGIAERAGVSGTEFVLDEDAWEIRPRSVNPALRI